MSRSSKNRNPSAETSFAGYSHPHLRGFTHHRGMSLQIFPKPQDTPAGMFLIYGTHHPNVVVLESFRNASSRQQPTSWLQDRPLYRKFRVRTSGRRGW